MKYFIILLILFVSCSSLEHIKDEKRALPFAKVLWSKDLTPIHNTGNLPIYLSSPYIYKNLVYFGKNDGKMAAYHIDTGRVIWEAEEDYQQFFSTPVVYKNILIYSTVDGRLYARDALKGNLIYKVDLGATIESPAVIYKDRLFVHLRNHQVFSLDARTGKILWAYRRSIPTFTTLQGVSTPLAYKNRIFVGFADGFVVSLSANDGTVLWERNISSNKKFTDVDQTPVIYKKHIYIGANESPMAILSYKNGKIKKRLPFELSASPYKYQNKLLLGTPQGELIKIDKKYKVIKRKKVSKSAIMQIVLWNNQLVITNSSGEFVIVSPKDFLTLGKFEFGHKYSLVFGQISVKKDRLAVVSSRGRLYVFYNNYFASR